jgi:hypothetical protein
MFHLAFPVGYLWEYPGFPSLTVSYLKTNDFFPSGHVGISMIGALEFFSEKKVTLGLFCTFTCVFEFCTMVVTRGHYFIDLVCGAIIAHYVYMLVEKYIYLVDDSCLAMKEREPNGIDARATFEWL